MADRAYLGEKEWYGEKHFHCEWVDIDCDVKTELRPAPLCNACIMSHLLGALQDIASALNDIRYSGLPQSG